MRAALPIIFGIGLIASASAQTITGFGTSDANPLNLTTDFLAPWTGTQNATTVSVMDVSNQSGEIFQDLSSSPVLLTAGGALSLTGTAQSVPAVTQFNVVLYDSSFNTLTGTFQWSDFTGGATVTMNLVEGGTFNGTVSSWGLDLFGAPAETVSFTFDELAVVVPEPSTVALCILSACGFLALLRRRVSQFAAE